MSTSVEKSLFALVAHYRRPSRVGEGLGVDMTGWVKNKHVA